MLTASVSFLLTLVVSLLLLNYICCNASKCENIYSIQQAPDFPLILFVYLKYAYKQCLKRVKELFPNGPLKRFVEYCTKINTICEHS